LVVFVEHVSDFPESLDLQRNELVYEIVRMIGEDYRKVQGEILLRLEELGRRIDEDFDVGELNELPSYLKRLEESKEKLVLLFVNRRKNNGFWELIKEIKMKGLKKKEEIEGKWIALEVAKIKRKKKFRMRKTKQEKRERNFQMRKEFGNL
jgi:hypothetical protein